MTVNYNKLRLRSFGVIWIRISDPRSVWIMVHQITGESMTRVDSPVPLMHHDQTDLGSLIRIRITPKERSLKLARVLRSRRKIRLFVLVVLLEKTGQDQKIEVGRLPSSFHRIKAI